MASEYALDVTCFGYNLGRSSYILWQQQCVGLGEQMPLGGLPFVQFHEESTGKMRTFENSPLYKAHIPVEGSRAALLGNSSSCLVWIFLLRRSEDLPPIANTVHILSIL